MCDERSRQENVRRFKYCSDKRAGVKLFAIKKFNEEEVPYQEQTSVIYPTKKMVQMTDEKCFGFCEEIERGNPICVGADR